MPFNTFPSKTLGLRGFPRPVIITINRLSRIRQACSYLHSFAPRVWAYMWEHKPIRDHSVCWQAGMGGCVWWSEVSFSRDLSGMGSGPTGARQPGENPVWCVRRRGMTPTVQGQNWNSCCLCLSVFDSPPKEKWPCGPAQVSQAEFKHFCPGDQTPSLQ